MVRFKSGCEVLFGLHYFIKDVQEGIPREEDSTSGMTLAEPADLLGSCTSTSLLFTGISKKLMKSFLWEEIILHSLDYISFSSNNASSSCEED